MTDLRKAAEMAFDLLCDAVEPTATQIQADIGMCAQWDVDAIECIDILRQALAQPEKETVPLADYKKIQETVTYQGMRLIEVDDQKPVAYWNGKDMFKRADEVQYVVNWTDYYHYPLYGEPRPCPTCESLARTVMMDQTSHDTPPKRVWKGLTDAEMFDALKSIDSMTVRLPSGFVDFAKAIEAKLKEKNNE